MAGVTLLTPGDCDDECYPCSVCCDDWYAPNEWYFWIDNLADTDYNSAGSAVLDVVRNHWYYWDNNDLLSVLQAAVINFQFAGTEPSSSVGGADIYRVLMDVPSLDCTADLNTAVNSGGVPILPYTTRTVSFTNFELDLQISLRCDLGSSGRRSIFTYFLRFDYSSSAGSGSSYLSSNRVAVSTNDFYDCPDQILDPANIFRNPAFLPRIFLPGIVSADFPLKAILDPLVSGSPTAYQGRAITHFAPP